MPTIQRLWVSSIAAQVHVRPLRRQVGTGPFAPPPPPRAPLPRYATTTARAHAPPPPPGASPSPPPTSRRRHCAGRAAVAEPFVTGDDVDMKAPISRGGVTGGRPSPRSTSPQLPRAKTPPRSDAPDRPKSRQRTGPGPGIAPAHGGGPDEGSVDGVADVTVSVGAPSCRGSAT